MSDPKDAPKDAEDFIAIRTPHQDAEEFIAGELDDLSIRRVENAILDSLAMPRLSIAQTMRGADGDLYAQATPDSEARQCPGVGDDGLFVGHVVAEQPSEVSCRVQPCDLLPGGLDLLLESTEFVVRLPSGRIAKLGSFRLCADITEILRRAIGGADALVVVRETAGDGSVLFSVLQGIEPTNMPTAWSTST